MPDDRTLVTELGTALGMLGADTPAAALAAGPGPLVLEPATWDRLVALHGDGEHAGVLQHAFANGRAFLASPDALRCRLPALVEWTGGRRPPGDEVAPVDLRVDHVYLVSCKYLSRAIANVSPARIFDGLLATTGSWDRSDWYEVVAPEEHRHFYQACRAAAGLHDLPDEPSAMDGVERRLLRAALPARRLPDEASAAAYRALCDAVSTRTARRWQDHLDDVAERQRLARRLLRIGNATYFLLGSDERGPLRLRVADAWDWHRHHRLLGLSIRASGAGQPQVDWTIELAETQGQRVDVHGHVEIRWSHGRFAQPPEAKVYIDTPTGELPGYTHLADPGTGTGTDQLPLWP